MRVRQDQGVRRAGGAHRLDSTADAVLPRFSLLFAADVFDRVFGFPSAFFDTAFGMGGSPLRPEPRQICRRGVGLPTMETGYLRSMPISGRV